MKRARGRRWKTIDVCIFGGELHGVTVEQLGAYTCATINLDDAAERMPDMTIELARKLLRPKVP